MQELLQNSGLSGSISDDIREALAQLLTEARSALPASPSEAVYRINRAAAILSQAQEMIARDETAVNRGGLAPWQARRAEAMIEKSLGEKLSVGALAEAVRLSPSHFRRAFRHTFGIAPHGYILRRRIDRAKELMQTTNDALADIALACGLADQSHFSTVFRRIECTSPNAWRRRCYPLPASPTAHGPKSPTVGSSVNR
jgi:AraC family transcriptional regulator